MCHSLADQLLSVANAYAHARGVSLSRVSTLAANDGKTLPRLAAGRDITLRTHARLLTWFSANWPEGATWPVNVDRPRIAADAA